YGAGTHHRARSDGHVGGENTSRVLGDRDPFTCGKELRENPCPGAVAADSYNDGVVREVGEPANRAEHRAADIAAPVTRVVIVQESDLIRGEPGSAAGAEDVRDDLSVAAGACNQDHRVPPVNSWAVA